ncbi:MAG TPA: hypothetical protein DCR21_04165 [Succinivibrionaceae bacterium]|nr:hypothetical protein [Succinivibrionaceae bacterium]
MTEKIKIFISYKEKHRIFKSDILTPIQTGRKISNEIFDSMIGDNTGDNISEDNPKYNELTAQYWVWKHYSEIGSPEYVGFMHYRRHFVFCDKLSFDKRKPWYRGMPVFLKKYGAEYDINLLSSNILKQIDGKYDGYVLKGYNIKKFKENDSYIREHYLMTIPGAKRVCWNAFYSSVYENFPDYREELDEFSMGSIMYCCNMFIFRKDLFFEYNNFCFSVLNSVDKKVDSNMFDIQEKRFLGYFGEYLLSIFIIKKIKQGYKFKFLDGILLYDMDPENFFVKLFKKNIKNIFSITNSGPKKVIRIFGINVFKYTSSTLLLKKNLEGMKDLIVKIDELVEFKKNK